MILIYINKTSNDDLPYLDREIVKILSEKCDLSEEEVRGSYEEFLLQYPEGEISKEEFVGSMKVK